MITPNDIQSMQFSRGVRGYREDEVDTFLDMMTLEFEKMFKENKRLSEEVMFLERELEKYRGAENEVTKTMEQAQRLMHDISESAEKRAEIIVRNAELDAEATMHEARERVQRLEEENKHLHERYILFRDKYKRMLEDELYRFESVTDDIFPDFEENKLERILADETMETAAAGAAETADTSDSSSGLSRHTMVMNAADVKDTIVSGSLASSVRESVAAAVPFDNDRKTVIMDAKEIEDAQDK